MAILTGVADERQAASIVERYPHSQAGAPVVWPQLPAVPIYHNRGIWPFVSAYMVRAARMVRNPRAFDHNLETLVRGAALNLSNMENFEFITQAAEFFDGELSGPVLNSRRQIWSVGGYLSMVLKGVLGLETGRQGVRFQPFLSSHLRNDYFGRSERISLSGYSYRGKRIDLDLILPARESQSAESCYAASRVLLNANEVGDRFIRDHELRERNQLRIHLGAVPCGSRGLNVLSVSHPHGMSRQDYEKVFAPLEPSLISLREVKGKLRLEYHPNRERNVAFNIYRNGKKVASRVSELSWVDPEPVAGRAGPSCYVVESEFVSSSNTSHHTRPLCHWPNGSIVELSAGSWDLRSRDGASVENKHGFVHFNDWGHPHQQLESIVFTPWVSGPHFVELLYGNGFGAINTGVTAAVKWVEVIDLEIQAPAAGGIVVMPHLGRWEPWGSSSVYRFELRAGRRYQLVIRDFMNMSYLEHFKLYTGSIVELSNPVNRANIQKVKLLRGF